MFIWAKQLFHTNNHQPDLFPHRHSRLWQHALKHWCLIFFSLLDHMIHDSWHVPFSELVWFCFMLWNHFSIVYLQSHPPLILVTRGWFLVKEMRVYKLLCDFLLRSAADRVLEELQTRWNLLLCLFLGLFFWVYSCTLFIIRDSLTKMKMLITVLMLQGY